MGKPIYFPIILVFMWVQLVVKSLSVLACRFTNSTYMIGMLMTFSVLWLMAPAIC